MGAYSVMETDEYTGGIVFAKSNLEARKIGANLWNGDELCGLEVKRRKDLDKYEVGGVPAWLLVVQGWHFECSGCGMRVSDETCTDEGIPVTGVVGTESGRVYCCHQCRMDHLASEAAVEAYGAAFLDMMRDHLLAQFPGIEPSFGDHRHHVYIPRSYRPFAVRQAEIRFSFPGMKIGPACMSYRHEGAYGGDIVGPVKFEFLCCNGDRDAFEAFARTAHTKEARNADN